MWEYLASIHNVTPSDVSSNPLEQQQQQVADGTPTRSIV